MLRTFLFNFLDVKLISSSSIEAILAATHKSTKVFVTPPKIYIIGKLNRIIPPANLLRYVCRKADFLYLIKPDIKDIILIIIIPIIQYIM